MSLLEIFCDLDDFCNKTLPAQKQSALTEAKPRRHRKRGLCPAEVMTLLVWFHRSGYRTFKDFYILHVRVFLKAEFPGLVSYNRFIEYTPSVLQALCAYLCARMGTPSGIAFVDSTSLEVCHKRRIAAHKVFAGLAQRGKTSLAQRGKTSTGWFFGFKAHLTINEAGELLSVRITAGARDDRVPVPNLTRALVGKLFGDKGYLILCRFRRQAFMQPSASVVAAHSAAQTLPG